MVKISKWRITWLVAGYLVLIAAVTFLLLGFTEEAARSLIRATARSSLILFLLAFSASSLQLIFQSDWASWILRNRRYIGVSFALSQGIHLLFLFVLAVYFPHPFLDKLTTLVLIEGGLAYAFITAMTITSFPRTRKWLGPRGWDILHTSGSYIVWFIFAQTYISMALKKPLYIPFAFALLLVLMLRVVRAFKRRTTASTAVQANS